jgi:hypothetical protein
LSINTLYHTEDLVPLYVSILDKQAYILAYAADSILKRSCSRFQKVNSFLKREMKRGGGFSVFQNQMTVTIDCNFLQVIYSLFHLLKIAR